MFRFFIFIFFDRILSACPPEKNSCQHPLHLTLHHNRRMVTVQQALEAYSVQIAKTIRTQCFFSRLGKSIPKSRQKLVMKARDDFFGGKVTQRMLQQKFGEEVVKACLDQSLTDCFARAEKRLSSDPTLPTCCVCLERGANYYVVHSELAHKCLCAVCAMAIALNPRPRCPVSRDDITLLVSSAEMSYSCVCLEKKCKHFLLVEERDVNNFRVNRAMVECYECSLEVGNHSAEPCRVYALFP